MSIFRILATMMLGVAAFTVHASDFSLPAYKSEILPNYVHSDREMLFQASNNLDGGVDTYHVDFVNRRWTRSNEFGSVSGSWEAKDEVGMDTRSPKTWLCLAGPWAFAGCVVAVPIAWVSCQAAATAAVRRAERACVTSGRTLEIRDSGVCGQNMQTVCINPARFTTQMP